MLRLPRSEKTPPQLAPRIPTSAPRVVWKIYAFQLGRSVFRTGLPYPSKRTKLFARTEAHFNKGDMNMKNMMLYTLAFGLILGSVLGRTAAGYWVTTCGVLLLLIAGAMSYIKHNKKKTMTLQ